MSNHDGSYMLNTMVHGLGEMGVLSAMSAAQRKSLCNLLWHVCWDYDCNWHEIMDAALARLLKTCADCGRESEEVSADHGLCAGCKGSE